MKSHSRMVPGIPLLSDLLTIASATTFAAAIASPSPIKPAGAPCMLRWSLEECVLLLVGSCINVDYFQRATIQQIEQMYMRFMICWSFLLTLLLILLLACWTSWCQSHHPSSNVLGFLHIWFVGCLLNLSRVLIGRIQRSPGHWQASHWLTWSIGVDIPSLRSLAVCIKMSARKISCQKSSLRR